MMDGIFFYVTSEMLERLVRDARFIPRFRYVEEGAEFDKEVGVWTESDIENGVPVRLLLPMDGGV